MSHPTQILREIKFGESRSYETGVNAIFGAMKFAKLVNITYKPPKKCKN